MRFFSFCLFPTSDAHHFFSLFSLSFSLLQFVYVKESFDERVGTLAQAYGSEGGTKLTLNYSTTPAWG